MRHIWVCLIDGCLVRSGAVQPGETMPMLADKLLRSFPHMGSDSLKVICEDGRIFDRELSFSNPTLRDPNSKEPDNLLAAVGVVDAFVGVKIHKGITVEEVLDAEAHAFSGKITDNMDFGVYDFNGNLLASIEDMMTLVAPEQAPDPLLQPSDENRHRRARRTRQGRRSRRGGGRQHSSNQDPPPLSPEETPNKSESISPKEAALPESSPPESSSDLPPTIPEV